MAEASYLSKMRIYRGSDEAVEIIGDRGNLIDILQNSGTHLRDKLIGIRTQKVKVFSKMILI